MSQQPHKIFYFITELKIGGAQKVLVHLLTYLDRQRFAPTVICWYGGDGIIANEIRAQNVPIIDLGMNSKWAWSALWRLYKLLRHEHPTILHTSLFHAVVPGRIIARLVGIPVVVSWRQNISLGGRIRERINGATSFLDDHVITVSQLARQTEAKYSFLPAGKISLIYNAVDNLTLGQHAGTIIRQEFDLSENTLLLGFVGRLHPQKGLFYLLDALPNIIHHYPNCKLLLVGDGALREQLMRRVNQMGLTQTVIFTGARKDVPTILAALDLFVLPSLWEGLPIALLEAMATGLPVVVTDVGGNREVVENETLGCVVPPADSEALYQAISQLLADSTKRQTMGQLAQEHIHKKFNARYMTKQIENLYDHLLTEKNCYM